MATCRLLLPSDSVLSRRPLRLTVQASIAGLLICVLLAASAPGENSKGTHRRTARFPAGSNPFNQPFSLPEVLDKDRDGELSSEEIAAAPGALVELDQDSDGLISAGEMSRTWEPPPGGPGGSWGGRGPQRDYWANNGPRFSEQILSRDADGDGRLTREELPAVILPLYESFDEDRNGWVSAAEVATVEGRLSGAPGGSSLLQVLNTDGPDAARMVQEALTVLTALDAQDAKARQELNAVRRAEWLLYSLTVGAMMTAVISFGHLMNFRPPSRGRWRDVNISPRAIQGLLYSLAFISVLSAFDLFWTTSHARNGHFQELNPFASAFLTDGASPWLFKVGAVAMSVLLLFSLRRFRGAQIASWWMCFVCTLLTFRWLLLDSSFLS